MAQIDSDECPCPTNIDSSRVVESKDLQTRLAPSRHCIQHLQTIKFRGYQVCWDKRNETSRFLLGSMLHFGLLKDKIPSGGKTGLRAVQALIQVFSCLGALVDLLAGKCTLHHVQGTLDILSRCNWCIFKCSHRIHS